MKLPFFNSEKTPVYGSKIEQSSLVGPARRGSLSSASLNRIIPRIEFWKREEFYLTVGRVQNVVETLVLNIINREWYYDSGDEEQDNEKAISQMEQWYLVSQKPRSNHRHLIQTHPRSETWMVTAF